MVSGLHQRLSSYLGRDMLAASLGVGCYFAWIHFATLGVDIFPWLAEGALPRWVLVLSLLFVVGACPLVFKGSRLLPESGRRQQIICATAIGTVGVLIAILGIEVFDSETIEFIGLVMSLVFAVILLPLWGCFLSSLSIDHLTFVIGLAFFINCLLFRFLAAVFSSEVYPYTMVLLPILCGIMLLAIRSAKPDTGVDDEQPVAVVEARSIREAFASDRHVLRAMCVMVFILIGLFVCESLRIIATPRSSVESFNAVNIDSAFTGMVLSVILAISAVALDHKLTFNVLLRVIIPVGIIGYVLGTLSTDSTVRAWLAGFGVWGLTIMLWITAGDVTRRYRLDPVSVFALVGGGLCAANLVAKLIFGTQAAANAIPISTAQLIAVIVLLVLMAIMLGDSLVGYVWPPATGSPSEPSEDAAEKTVDSELDAIMNGIADAHGLTPREKDVFLLLGKGRSLPFIEDALSISSGTAQTHTMHIYKKLDIHNRQELLDLIHAAADRHGE